jgi:hypothetical protein
LNEEQLQLLTATQYINASELIFRGLKDQHKNNIFHFAITLRSFIEYTRRGIWFLCWADQEKLKRARKLTFDKPGSPSLVKMDEMINEALGNGRIASHGGPSGNQRTIPSLPARPNTREPDIHENDSVWVGSDIQRGDVTPTRRG